MKSEVKVFDRGNGEIQRAHVVSWDDWSQLDFLYLRQETAEQQKRALDCFYHIYHKFLVPTNPLIFPQMVMFALPDDVELPKEFESNKYGRVSDRLTVATILLQEGVSLKKGKATFKTKQAENLYQELEKRGFIHIVCGKMPNTKMIPIGRFAGYLSEVEENAKIKANANFFIMDPFDCSTSYDQVGTPFGLCVKDGEVLTPPCYNREALLVGAEGAPYISQKDIFDLTIEIGGHKYIHGENAIIYTRPNYAKTPNSNRVKVVIVGRKVVAVKESGSVPVPTSGYVLCLANNSVGAEICPGDEVIYHGLEDIKFGIQVGNSIVRDGVKTEEFISKFYNIYKLEPIPYPPSLYPMDFAGARAARMAIGADAEGKPVMFWAEGKGKLEYVEGRDSTGASLTEMAEIAEALGLRNAVNLDGGGSAQILLENVRTLRISDRKTEDNSDAERLVPLGLMVK